MQLHQLKPTHKRKHPKRVGRGGKRGTYSGKGVKGQNARAGRKFRPAIRDLIKRYPKLRGYKFKFQIINSKLQIVNLDVLEKNFEAGQTINPQALLEKGIIRRIKGITPKVKILGGGELKKSLTVENCLVSKQAKEKIIKAGGQINGMAE